MRIAYLRQGQISFDSTFGYEHTRIGLASAMVALGHEFAFFNCSPKPWKDEWSKFGAPEIKAIREINDAGAQSQYLRKTDVLVVEQAERALPRFWMNPGNKGRVSDDNIATTWLYRFWWTLGQFEGPVLLIYNDPKCRAQLLPESIALRYLQDKPIAEWTSRNKRLTVITECNYTEGLVKKDAAWRDNTDMSGKGFGLKAYSANLSTIFFGRGMKHRMGATSYGVRVDPAPRDFSMIYFGKPKNQRPKELFDMAANLKDVLCVGTGWSGAKYYLERRYGKRLDNWKCVDTVRSRVELRSLIARAKYCACPGDKFYYDFHSLTARPLEGAVDGCIPVVSELFHREPVTPDKFLTDDLKTQFPRELLCSGDKLPPKFGPSVTGAMSNILSWEEKSEALATRLLKIAQAEECGHTGSLSAAFTRYFNYRFSPTKLKSYPMADEHINRARNHGLMYGADLR